MGICIKSKSAQIEQFILDNIQNKVYKPKDKIPSEKEFCEMFSVSRMTVNNAIRNLAIKGYLTTKRGYGTTVNLMMEKELINLTSFTEDLKNLGMNPRAILLNFECTSQNYEYQKSKILLEPDSLIYKIKRLRLDDQDPIAIDIAYLSAKLVPTIDISYLEHSLYDYLENVLNIKIKYSVSEITAIKADKELADLLNIQKGDPLLRACHITYTEDEQPFEYVETYYNSEKYTFSNKAYR